MEQFQQEMWIRFATPLIRLDSAGIQWIKQKLPGSTVGKEHSSLKRRALSSKRMTDS